MIKDGVSSTLMNFSSKEKNFADLNYKQRIVSSEESFFGFDFGDGINKAEFYEM